jgi:hypothetical protein
MSCVWVMKNAVLWKSRRGALVRTDGSEERIAYIIRVARIGELGMLAVTSNRSMLGGNTNSVLQLLVTVNVVPSSPILVTLLMELIRSSETSVLTRATRRHIAEDDIRSHRRENLSPTLCLGSASGSVLAGCCRFGSKP